jgi:hypothetical protein
MELRASSRAGFAGWQRGGPRSQRATRSAVPEGRAHLAPAATGLLELLGLVLVLALVLVVVGAHVRALWTGEQQYDAGPGVVSDSSARRER